MFRRFNFISTLAVVFFLNGLNLLRADDAGGDAKRYSLFTKQEQDILDRGRVSGGRIASGTLVAAVVGFGVGHVVVGSYEQSNAWIYTIVDGVLVTLILVSPIIGMKDDSPNDTSDGAFKLDLNLGPGVAVLGFSFLGLALSHLIQAVHVISASAGHNNKFDEISKRPSSLQSLYVAPALLRDGAGLQFGFRF